MSVNTSAKAVLFDLDDTLLDSLEARVYALEHVFTEAHIPLKADEYLFSLNGSPFVEALKELEKTYGIGDDLYDRYCRAYWFDSRDIVHLYPGIKKMLDKLKSNGFTLGIVTSTMHKTRFEGQRIGCAGDLERLGIAGLFTIVIGHEDVQKLKPNPECIGLALDKIGIAPENTFVVGDTLADIQAAKAVGCRSCQAVWGIEGEYQDNGADFIARTPADVLAILKHSV